MESGPTRDALNAYIDGELPPEEMARIAAVLKNNPEAEAWVKRQEAMRAATKNALSEMLAAPPPERLVRAARAAPISWRWHLRYALIKGSTVKILASAGAALALGIVIGISLKPSAYMVSQDGQVVAQGKLASALNTQLASDRYTGPGPHIGISFRNRNGQDCRTFLTGGQSGLACHAGNGWAIAMLVGVPSPESKGPFRMTGSEMPDAIRAAVAANIQGRPFDAAAEKAARERGWK